MSNLDDALKELAKMGIDVAARDARRYESKLEKFSTGLLSLDYILGGGYPKGRIIEIFGWESSGKSTLCLLSLAAVQRAGGVACLVDAEHAFDPEWAAKMGIDADKLLVAQPESGEQALQVLDKLAASGEVSLIVVDSLAAMIPQKELDGELGDTQVGTQARMMSQGLRRVTATASKSNTTIIFINQLRQKVGVIYGNPDVTPGGMALKFYASLRFKVSRKEKLQESKDSPIVGHKVKVDVVKTKVSQPYLNTDFNMLFTGGIDQVVDTFNVALSSGVIVKDGTSYMLGDTRIAIGYDATIEALRCDPGVYETVRCAVAEKIGALKGTVLVSLGAPAEDKDAKKKKR